MREVSDRLCKEYGLSVIRNPKAKGKSYAEWRAEFEGRPTVRGTIREAIDIAVSGSGSRLEFLDAMDQMGFIIDQSGKYPKIKHLYIRVTHKTPDEMAQQYGFTDEQKEQLRELLSDKNKKMWNGVLYGYTASGEDIVSVALSQLGNKGGEPYSF